MRGQTTWQNARISAVEQELKERGIKRLPRKHADKRNLLKERLQKEERYYDVKFILENGTPLHKASLHYIGDFKAK